MSDKEFPIFFGAAFNSPLTFEERATVSRWFPNAKVKTMSKLAPGDMAEKDASILKPYCDLFGCNSETKKVVFDGERYHQATDQVCLWPGIHCEDVSITSIAYNCIGWAVGIRDWLDPSMITALAQRNGSPVSAINMFLTMMGKTYGKSASALHDKNIIKIVDKLQVEPQGCTPLYPSQSTAEHDVSFYFKGDECTHAARYVNKINGTDITSWTSKLGKYLLVTHTLADLSDNSATASYGVPVCTAQYFNFKEAELTFAHIIDEL